MTGPETKSEWEGRSGGEPAGVVDGPATAAVCVYALGRFSLLVRGIEVRFAGKAQRRPIELLRLILALGGGDIAESRLMDALWPDADADMAARAFAVTLHRLRVILRQPGAVERRGGRIALCRLHVWTDVWAFESLVAKGGRPADALAEAALGLYRGSFLANEDSAPWAVAPRERLRSKFVRTLDELARIRESMGALADAERLWLRMLDVEPTVEELHVHLMRLYGRQGRLAAAASAYRRCRDTLAALCNGVPSPETERCHQDLLRQATAWAAPASMSSGRSGERPSTSTRARYQATESVQR